MLPITSDPERFRELKYVCVGDCAEHTKVLSVRVSGAEVFLFLERVIDRSAAEALRGQYLSVEREDAVKEEGSYFICDLEGCRVTLDDGTELGILTEVLQQSDADVYWVKKPGGKRACSFRRSATCSSRSTPRAQASCCTRTASARWPASRSSP